MADDTSAEGRCDFCRHEIILEPVTAEYEGKTYAFCSGACREKMAEEGFVFSEYHGFRRFEPGVSGLDAKLPQGLPRNSFVLLSGMAGTRQEAIQAELAWRMLQRGEPVVALTFTEPPGAFVQTFLSLGWNVLPYLDRGDFHLVDCFTYRVGDRDRMFDRMDRWNRHLYDVARDVTVTVRDAGDTSEVQNKLDNCLEAQGMSDRGAVFIDSLTEVGSLVQPVQAYNFLKDLRADVSKGRYVPVFAGATFTGDDEKFPHDLGYVVDGIVELELNNQLVRDTLIKRIRIRKMCGVLSISEWIAYEYTEGLGMVTFDPEEEIEKKAEGEVPEGEAAEAPEGEAPAEAPKGGAAEAPEDEAAAEAAEDEAAADAAESGKAEE